MASTDTSQEGIMSARPARAHGTVIDTTTGVSIIDSVRSVLTGAEVGVHGARAVHPITTSQNVQVTITRPGVLQTIMSPKPFSTIPSPSCSRTIGSPLEMKYSANGLTN